MRKGKKKAYQRINFFCRTAIETYFVLFSIWGEEKWDRRTSSNNKFSRNSTSEMIFKVNKKITVMFCYQNLFNVDSLGVTLMMKLLNRSENSIIIMDFGTWG